MADLKPLGSEKLKADAKLKRILELTYYGENKNKTITESTSPTMRTEYLSESINGFKYGIVKEKDGFYVKKGLNESSLDYIGGLFMKNKNRFNSYAEALKRLELLSGAELNEATKYVLKQKPSAPEGDMGALPPAPGGNMGADLPPAPEGDMGADLPPAPEGDMGALPPSPEGDMGADLPPSPEGDMGTEGAPKPSDYMTEVQKFAGKLGQELRDQKDKMESDDIKYVLNMIISAVDLDKLDDEDIEEIGSKFDREVEDDATMGDEPLPTDDESVPEEPTGDEELGEMMGGMDKLESFVNQPIETDEINLSKYADLGGGTNEEDLKEIDLDEIKSEINKSIAETLGKYFK